MTETTDDKVANIPQEELLEKLRRTEAELASLQCRTREIAYDEGRRPQNQNEATFSFLHDAIFHFLTEIDAKAREVHLRAILKLLQYTEVQIQKISKATGMPVAESVNAAKPSSRNSKKNRSSKKK